MIDEHLLSLYNDLLKNIRMGIYLARTYPEGHPSLAKTIQRLRTVFKEIKVEKKVVLLVVIENVITIEGERFEPEKFAIVKYLVDRFHQIGIKSVSFNIEVSEHDLKEFFSAMAVSTHEVADYGDIVGLIRSKGIKDIKVNRYKVGVVSSDEQAVETDWGNFLETLVTAQHPVTEEEKMNELGNFLSGLGVAGDESIETQSKKIITGLEKLALMLVDQYGEGRWNEYSLVFSRILALLSPTIKRNIIKYRTENKKLADLFRNLVPTMDDDDIIDIIVAMTKNKTSTSENEVIDILKNITTTKLPDILTTVRSSAPEFYTEKFVAHLMDELRAMRGTEEADKFMVKNLEVEMKNFFPRLRDESLEERIKTLDELIEFSERLFKARNYDMIKLLANRLDTMAEAETELTTFSKAIDTLKILHIKSKEHKNEDTAEFISKKFAKYLMLKEEPFLERKKVVIKAIAEMKDKSYVTELISSLWAPGTFGEAREALIALSDFSTPLLIETLKETEDYSIRMKILDIMKRMSDKVIPEVLPLLWAKEWYVRRNGIFILGELKATKQIDEIGRLIDDVVEQIQLEVVSSLKKINGPRCKEYIKKALKSKYRLVVLQAMRYLDKEIVQPKIPEVIDWLRNRKSIPNEEEETFRGIIIDVLGQIGDDSVVKALIGVIKERALFRGHLLNPTKEAALNALACIGTPNAIQALQKAASSRNLFIATTAQAVLQRLKSAEE